MTATPRAGRRLDWLRLAACPDCGAAVDAIGDSVAADCTGCGRAFAAVANGLNMLPADAEPHVNDAAPTGGSWRSRFVAAVYTRHNRSAAVRRALDRVLGVLGEGDWGLNVGSADTRYRENLLNLDIAASQNVDVVATADRLPFKSNSLACVISQEVFEHLPDPICAAREVLRVLRPGGLFYFQVPFIIGFHSGPHDYWRFSHRGVERLLSTTGFEIVEIGAAVGAGTSMYRIGVEFCATLAAAVFRRLYMPAKAVAAVLLAPLRWTDFLAAEYSETNRIAAGFYAIARKSLDRP